LAEGQIDAAFVAHQKKAKTVLPPRFEIPEAYRMIQSLEITNFRGFKHIALSNLPRFNILIGESGSGKTSFLEALWIQGGQSPEIYFRTRALRGMAEQQFVFSDKLSYEAFFRDIFRDPSQEAQIQIMDSESGLRYLNIGYTGTSQITLNMDKPQPSSASVRPLIFRWRLGDADYPCPIKVVNNQFAVDNPPDSYPAVFFASALPINARETAERLSILDINGETERVVETIKKIYTNVITDLHSQTISGQQMVWASVKGMKNQIPLPSVSSGVNRLVAFILWASLNRGGVLLIDEIENGFYFSDYEKVFQSLVEFCDTNQIQMFAATHSKEFLQAVARVMQKREKELCMLRPKFMNGECTIQQIEGVSSIEAINQDIEIRL
jgi:AAA15 family ATPase/GTPase